MNTEVLEKGRVVFVNTDYLKKDFKHEKPHTR